MDPDATRPDLVGEVRFKIPLVVAIPVTALVVIGALAFGFSRVLLNVPREAAIVIAIVMAINILGACTVVALRPRMSLSSMVELALVALYPVVIGVVISYTGFSLGSEGAATAEANEEAAAPAGGATTVVAESVAFDTEELTLEADKPNPLTLDNQDTVLHNLSIYEEEGGDTLFSGPDVNAGESAEFTIDPLPKGEYVFICDYHPTTMKGTVAVE